MDSLIRAVAKSGRSVGLWLNRVYLPPREIGVVVVIQMRAGDIPRVA